MNIQSGSQRRLLVKLEKSWRGSFLVLGLLLGCSPSTSPKALDQALDQAPRQAPGGRGVRIEPRTESMQNAATVGRGEQRCHLFVYPWEASTPRCRVSVTHCMQTGAEEQCVARADERRIACDAKEDICGEDVACACPSGPARPVEDPPGTVKLRAGGKGATWKSPGCRAEEVDELPRIGKPPMPACLMLIHDCDEGQTCDERMYTLSCGIRSDVCGRPVHCACP